MTTYSLNDRWQENRDAWREYWKDFTIEKFATTLIIVAVSIVIFGYFNQHGGVLNWTNIFGDFYANVSSELISIVITVLIVDRLNRAREKRDQNNLQKRLNEQELTRLKALLESNENVVMNIAVAELRAKGWLEDGSLVGMDLINANLEGIDLTGAYLEAVFLNNANLEHANLHGAYCEMTNFSKANLQKANLSRVNLEGADLRWANLEDANLSEAILPDGTRWSQGVDMGRFTNLKHPEYKSTLVKCHEIAKKYSRRWQSWH